MRIEFNPKNIASRMVLRAANCSSKGGFTLVEVLISVFVLSVVFGSAYALLVQSQYVARATAHHAHALQVARSNLEALRKYVGYADSALSTGVHTGAVWQCPQVYSINREVVYVEYRPFYTVTQTTLGSGVSYKTVAYEVRWDEKSITGMHENGLAMSTVISSSLNR